MMATPFYNRMLANTEHCHMSFITHTECTHKMMNRQASWDCSPGQASVCIEYVCMCVCLDKPSPGIVHQGRTTSVCIECVCMCVCVCLDKPSPGIVHQGQTTSVCIEYVCACLDKPLTWDCSPGSDD